MDKKAQAGGCKKRKESWGNESEGEEKKINASRERGKGIYIIPSMGGEKRKGNTVKLISSRCGDAWQDPLFVPVKLMKKEII